MGGDEGGGEAHGSCCVPFDGLLCCWSSLTLIYSHKSFVSFVIYRHVKDSATTAGFEKPRRPGPQRPRRPGFSGVQCPSGLPRFGEERADQRLVLVRGEAILRMVLSQFPPDYM